MLQLALDASDQGVWRWELGDGPPRFIWDARCRAVFGVAPDAPVDYESWVTGFPADERLIAEAAISRALDPGDAYDDYASEHRVLCPDGRVLWVATIGRALFIPDVAASAGRRAVRIIGTARDISGAKRDEQERQRADALLRTIMGAAPGLIYAKDMQGRMLLANASVMTLLGKPWDQIEGRSDAELLPDQTQAAAVMVTDRRIMDQARSEKLEEVVSEADGQPRVWLSTKAPMLNAQGEVIGLVGVSMEITAQRRAQDHLRLMLNELNHRVKNTLATVQAITSQTLRGLDSNVRRNLDSRLQALASAHDVLTRESWQGASLADVVAGALAPFDGWNATRFWICGPVVALRPQAVLMMAMGLHELATNALRFGALSVEAGRVEICWELTADERPLLRLLWTERNGPEVISPAHPGFGTRLIERSLAQDLRGNARISFDDPRGVTCRIEAPLAEVITTAETLPFPRVGGF